jgi:hypothetical protein
LQEFPFDYQIAQIVLETTATNEAAVFVVAPNIQSGIHPSGLVVDGWDIDTTGYRHTENFYPALEETYDRVTVYFTLQRQSVYYTSRYGTHDTCATVPSPTYASTLLRLQDCCKHHPNGNNGCLCAVPPSN